MKKILLTGSTGYIGKRMISVIASQGHQVLCCARDASRFDYPEGIPREQIEVIEVDFLDKKILDKIPKDIDGAYYLMHSMSNSSDYQEMEKTCAHNFVEIINQTKCEHVIYLTGLANQSQLSKHLDSRLQVEKILAKGEFNFTKTLKNT